MIKRNLMAFDLGASNGRGIVGAFDGERVTLTEVHRFENNFYEDGSYARWNANRLLENLQTCFVRAKAQGLGADCFGVDTWGVDYGLLDNRGALIGDPRAYRCSRDADMASAWEIVDKRTLFDRAGIANMNFNTLYQLHRRVQERDEELAAASALLLMPDLIGYLLTGERGSEYTNVTTTNLYNVHTHDWDWEVIEKIGIPAHIFTKIDRAGTLRGRLRNDIADALSVPAASFAAVGTHDTASAVAAIPGSGSFAFCSSGTWSLFGVETDAPVLTDGVYASNFSNEGTVQGGCCPLKNIMGLWLIQECRREWQRQGQTLSWNDIVIAAKAAKPFRSIIDPDHGEFFTAGDMPGKISRYCKQTNQPVPESVGEIARCIYESLALEYRWALERLEEIKGARIDSLNITGGGIQNALLNQMAADSIGRPVITGPVEGAALGNILLQAVAMGLLRDITEVREVVSRSVSLDTYEPHRTAAWDDAYARLLALSNPGDERMR